MKRRKVKNTNDFKIKELFNFDKGYLYLALTLIVLGTIAVADASAPQSLRTFNDRFFLVRQQMVWAVLGLVGMFVVSLVNYRLWAKVSKYLFIASIFLLLLVLIPGVGGRFLGARRWIVIGNFTLQPSELVKLALCCYFANLADKQKRITSFLVPLGIVAMLIMMQPDLGTTLIVSGIGLAQIFLSGVSIINLIIIFASGIGATFLAIILSPYRRERLLTFINQAGDPLGSSYHIRQILFSLGLGGLFGVGLGSSRQKFLFLPEAGTDSVFAVIAEEIGFFGSTLLIILFLVYILRGIKIVKNAPDKFSFLLAGGIVSWHSVQIILNIASMLALVPLTGVPLPFFSYGGSSLFNILISVGILLNISKFKKLNYGRN